MRWDGHESAYRVTGDRLFEPPTPTGFRHLAQDCPRSGLPWVRESWTSQPPRGCVLSRGNPLGSIGDVRRNPVGVEETLVLPSPRVGSCVANPGLRGDTPLGYIPATLWVVPTHPLWPFISRAQLGEP